MSVSMKVPIDSLLTENFQSNTPIFLDLSSYRQFVDWISTKIDPFKEKIKSKHLKVLIFEHQLEDIFPTDDGEDPGDLFRALDIEFSTLRWKKADGVFFAEIQEIYFHDENARLSKVHAEFLILSRYATVGETVKVITHYPCFLRIPNVEVYYLEGNPNKIRLPANFDFFVDLELHEKLHSGVKRKFLNHEYQDGLLEAFRELVDTLRTYSGISASDIPSEHNLAQSALKKDGSKIKLNHLSNDTETGEQRGYQEITMGIMTAIRNPITHLKETHDFINSRFNDEKTALKIIALISLILERLDERIT